MAVRSPDQRRRQQEARRQAYQMAQDARAVERTPRERRRNRLALWEIADGSKPCTAATPRCSDARDYDSELRPCCRELIVDLSREVAAAFDASGVTYWMDYGTLLGAFRNPMTTWADFHWLPQEDRPAGPLAPGIIPHDKDADWGVMGDQWHKAYLALQAHCRRRTLRVRPPRVSIKVCVSHVNRTNLDLFFWHEHHRKPGLMHRHKYAQVDVYKGKHFDKADLFPLQPMEWEGLQLPAPKDPEAWLEFRYGPNWRTPIPANHDGVKR